MLILAIESSCDETAAAISENGRKILSDVVFSQVDMHAEYGGVVPEIASRKHVEKVSFVALEAVKKAGISPRDINAVAATCAPGLIGALLVGANFGKAAALSLGVPFIPVHHIRGHIAANYVAFPELEPPFCALVASGGHTVIADVRGYTDMEVLGTTRDDAAGEAFDKTARVMGLPYPGGAAMDGAAKKGDPKRFRLPRAVIEDAPFDMSFSGVKTAAVNLIHNFTQKGEEVPVADIAAAINDAVCDSIVPRVVAAAESAGRKTVVAAGGVAANSFLRARLSEECGKKGIKVYYPPLSLCGDNGSMIACQAYYEYLAGNVGNSSQNCYATMPLSENLSKLAL
ncbi:MAG: tRNA (adenosine(37)-N6)-threonylcarbamoyltransferase complex transferase subunit TsaD [Clostridia bacterium]|nr:tRNA (adenosine(37)-N6)-threonylcarbamoyltransferase complex transferase subunit TsaD [Clostridia bacterium]